jgi:hypothetical protein
MNHPDVGYPSVSWRVPNRGRTAACVPAQKTVLAQRYAGKCLEPGGEMHMLREHSYDLGASILVDDPRRTKEARECLAILAIADGSSSSCGRDDMALKRAAAAPKWMVHCWSIDDEPQFVTPCISNE